MRSDEMTQKSFAVSMRKKHNAHSVLYVDRFNSFCLFLIPSLFFLFLIRNVKHVKWLYCEPEPVCLVFQYFCTAILIVIVTWLSSLAVQWMLQFARTHTTYESAINQLFICFNGLFKFILHINNIYSMGRSLCCCRRVLPFSISLVVGSWLFALSQNKIENYEWLSIRMCQIEW